MSTPDDDKKGPIRSRRASRRSLSFRVGSSLLTGALALGGCDSKASPEDEKIHVNPGPSSEEPSGENQGQPKEQEEEPSKKEEAGQTSETTSEEPKIIQPPVNPGKVEPKDEKPPPPPIKTNPGPVKTNDE